MRVEVLLAWEDGTWETKIVEPPDEIRESMEVSELGGCEECHTELWAFGMIARDPTYRKVVYVNVVDFDPDPEDEANAQD